MITIVIAIALGILLAYFMLALLPIVLIFAFCTWLSTTSVGMDQSVVLFFVLTILYLGSKVKKWML